MRFTRDVVDVEIIKLKGVVHKKASFDYDCPLESGSMQ